MVKLFIESGYAAKSLFVRILLPLWKIEICKHWLSRKKFKIVNLPFPIFPPEKSVNIISWFFVGVDRSSFVYPMVKTDLLSFWPIFFLWFVCILFVWLWPDLIHMLCLPCKHIVCSFICCIVFLPACLRYCPNGRRPVDSLAGSAQVCWPKKLFKIKGKCIDKTKYLNKNWTELE